MGRDVRHPERGSRKSSRPSASRRPRRGSRLLPILLVLGLLGGGVAALVAEDRGALPEGLPELLPGQLGGSEEADPAAGRVGLPAVLPPAPVLDGVEAADAGRIDAALAEAALAPALADRSLGRRVSAAVADLAMGSPVAATGVGPLVPASTTKILTATAALQTLGPEHRFTTRVVAGARPRDVVLVGGGDPLLERTPAAAGDGSYPARADLETLARATAVALAGRTRVRVTYDDSLFTGPTDNPAWPRDYLPDDVVSPITALWVDGGREADGFSRSADPSRAAADAFAAALRRQGVRVAGTPAPAVAAPGAAELAAVTGAPLSLVVERVLDTSDNEAAEVLAHHVGLAVSGEGSFTAGAAGTLATLEALGVPLEGARLFDGSGLSRRNRLDPATLVAVLQTAAAPDHPTLRAVLTGLPVAGFTGSLAARFEQGSPLARGSVRAKTGTLTGVHLLAGIVTDRDGDTMAFVVGADRVPVPRTLDARATLDRAAAALAACRCAAAQ